MPEPRMAVGVDVGGTLMKAAVCTETGTILCRLQTDTIAREGYEAVLRRMVGLVEDLVTESRLPKSVLLGVGVGLPGRVDPRAGDAILCPNVPGFVNVPVVRPLQDAIGLKVRLGNDAGCAGLGEFHFGAGKGARDMVMLTLGTGIGGAVIQDGQLRRGSRQVLGELGHQVVDVNGPECGCGQHGCLEAFCGKEGIVRRTREQLQRGRVSMIPALVNGDPLKITPQAVAEAARAGDAVALDVLEWTGFYLAAGVVNAIVFCDPDIVVIGGQVAEAGEPLFGPLRRTVEARSRMAQFRGERIVPAKLGADAGVIGAACLVLEPEAGIPAKK